MSKKSKYSPKLCEAVLGWAKNGAGYAEIAARIGVTVQTLKVWEKRYPEFFSAMTSAYKNDALRQHLANLREWHRKRDNWALERDARKQARREQAR